MWRGRGAVVKGARELEGGAAGENFKMIKYDKKYS